MEENLSTSSRHIISHERLRFTNSRLSKSTSHHAWQSYHGKHTLMQVQPTQWSVLFVNPRYHKMLCPYKVKISCKNPLMLVQVTLEGYNFSIQAYPWVLVSQATMKGFHITTSSYHCSYILWFILCEQIFQHRIIYVSKPFTLCSYVFIRMSFNGTQHQYHNHLHLTLTSFLKAVT